MIRSLLLALLLLTASGSVAFAETLITEAEAALPAHGDSIALRGVTRGPTVKLLSPAETRSPFALRIKFEAHGGAKVEPGSVKLVYLKKPVVDITERVKPFLSADGIDMAKAEVPIGLHDIRVELKDSDGRTGGAVLRLVVSR